MKQNSIFARDSLTMLDFFTPKISRSTKVEKSAQTQSSQQAQDNNATPPTSSSSTLDAETPPTPREHGGISTSTPPTPVSQEERSDSERSNHQTTRDETSARSSNAQPRGKATQCRKRKYEQLYLDFGQSSFGARTVCPICNTLYVHGVEEDEINHRKICDEYIHGVSFHGFKHSRVYPVELVLPKSHALSTGTATMAKVVEVKPSDTNQQLIRKVIFVKSIIDQEMGFVSSCNILENKVAFLYVLEKRVVGFCLVENISRAYKVVSSENDDQGQTVVTNDSNDSYVNQKNDQDLSADTDDSDSGIQNGTGSHPVASRFVRSLSPTKALMGVHQIWCHRNFRRQGISKALLDVAREKFIFGMVIPRDMVAFSSPTMDGFCLACHYSDTQYPLVYDCL